jgi:hypothetical protein
MEKLLRYNQACKNQHEKPSLGESLTKNMEKRKTKCKWERNQKKIKENQKEPKENQKLLKEEVGGRNHRVRV